MTEWTFGPGEEKLAAAFELIASLQTNTSVLKAQLEVDALAIAALINLCEDVSRVRDAFRQIAATRLTDDALRLVGSEHLRAASEAASARVAYWNDVLDGVVSRGPI